MALLLNPNLQCKENTPAPTGGRNIVQGVKEDQCASFVRVLCEFVVDVHH